MTAVPEMPRRCRVWLARCLALLLAMLLGACGSGGAAKPDATSPVTHVSSKTTGWLYDTADTAMFVSWTDRDGELAGVAQIATSDETGRFTSRSLRIAGVRSDDALTLTLDAGELSGSRTWSGHMDGRTVVLSVPLADGTLTEARFDPASLDDFNRAVARATESASDRAAEQKRLDDERHQRQIDEEAARAAEELRRALVQEVADLRSISDDMHGVDHFVGARGSYGGALGDLGDRIAELDQKIAARTDCGSIEVAFGSVEVARGSVEVAHGSWEVAVGSLDRDSKGVQAGLDGVARLQTKVPPADWPANLGATSRAGRDALAAIASEGLAFEKQVLMWDRDADERVSAAKKRTTASCG
jgi:hypothetical protein